MAVRNPPTRHPSYDKKVGLVLQGGGALGSYQAGVYEALASSEYLSDWVASSLRSGLTFLVDVVGMPLVVPVAKCIRSDLRAAELTTILVEFAAFIAICRQKRPFAQAAPNREFAMPIDEGNRLPAIR
jgi:hypothetical protein